MSHLERKLEARQFVVTAELPVIDSGGHAEIRRQLAPMEAFVDAFNATDNPSGHAHASSLAVSLALLQEGVEPIMQLACRDRNRIALEADLVGASMHGIENISCMTGDDVTAGDEPEAPRVFDLDSPQLIALARALSRGRYLSGRPLVPAPRFLIGAVENPGTPPVRVPRPPRRDEGACRPRFAIAFDLGTTTVVATLLDLDSGQPVAVRSMLNRQQPHGADVITRISATMMDPTALGRLRERAHETLAALTGEVCAEGQVGPREVYEITVCGNVTMMQLALGIDPEPLSMAPFTVSTHSFPPVKAREFGVEIHPRAPAFVFPSLGAYVGGDIVAGMLATGLTRDRRLRLFIDVGTNSEIALGSGEQVLATAAPAGPAFEAAQIKCGMRASEGAIEGIRIDGDQLELDVIGDAEPVGICGSGLVDAVAELVQAGLLDHSGRFIADEQAALEHPALASRLTVIGKERVFVLHWRGSDPESSVFLSQRDVRELQFAKAATGWSILLQELGAGADEITQVLLAGSFGAYLSPLRAVRIGLVPRLALPRIVSAGNVAGEGAKIAALSARERAEAYSIVNEVGYVELSGRADFNDLFIDQLALPG